MSTTNSLYQKAVKQLVQTFGSKQPPTIEATQEDQTTESSGTVKYRMSGRYELGWTDPRALWTRGTDVTQLFQVPRSKDHFVAKMSDEQVRAAWLITFGSTHVTLKKILSEGEDGAAIAKECDVRGMLYTYYSASYDGYLYKLKNDGNH